MLFSSCFEGTKKNMMWQAWRSKRGIPKLMVQNGGVTTILFLLCYTFVITITMVVIESNSITQRGGGRARNGRGGEDFVGGGVNGNHHGVSGGRRRKLGVVIAIMVVRVNDMIRHVDGSVVVVGRGSAGDGDVGGDGNWTTSRSPHLHSQFRDAANRRVRFGGARWGEGKGLRTHGPLMQGML